MSELLIDERVMKYKGVEYEAAIKQLKKLNKTNVAKYKELLHEVMEKYGVSYITVRRHMKQRVPGLRKTRTDSGKNKTKLTHKEKQMTGELIAQGKSVQIIKEIVESKTGKKMSMRKANKLKEAASEHVPETEATSFGNEAREFFNQLFEYDLIAPEKGIKCKFKSVSFIVKKEDLHDIILILSNAYNRSVFEDEKKLKANRDEIRKALIQHLIEDQMRLAKEGGDYKLVEAITRMIDRLKEDSKLPDDFDTVVKVCRLIKPALSESDVIELIKRAVNG